MSAAQPIGHVEYLQLKRERLIGHLSPAARHRNFPQIYARPVPADVQRRDYEAEIARLKADNKRLLDKIARLAPAPRQVKKNSASVNCLAVMDAYCEALEAIECRIDGMPWTIEHLKSPRRSRFFAWPRHVGMWLCKVLCPEASYPTIGHVFGGRDHTSAMHGFRHAPQVFKEWPHLHTAAQLVLAAYGPKKTAVAP